jgi:phage shock protein C
MKRSKTDKVIAGICGGIGKATGISPWLFRLLFFFGSGLWVYLLMWIFIEEEA